ncbi:hypothetical protein ACIQNI_20850 [Streptomyces sp. NPDC091266]|uniref:hypothetical protein n=1 Tax=Streptomyces sp. NPDC091266 TaxID=3365978 RepID=UPI00382AAC3B
MNIRSLTRGDGVVIGAAVLLFIASFLNFYSLDCPGDCGNASDNLPNGWESKLFPVLPSIFLAGIIAAALIVVGRALGTERKFLGLDLGQLGVGLSLFATWTCLWMLFDSSQRATQEGVGVGIGIGHILAFLALLVMSGAALAGPKVPALQGRLIPDKPVGGPSPYGAGPNPGYGYPGAQQQQQPGHGYGYPGAHQQPQPGQPGPGQPQPGQSYGGQQAPAGGPQGATAAAGAPADFAPFWFAVPVARPLYGEDGSPSPIAELAPGTWYLAVEQRGQALIAQTQDGRRGVLQDTTGIQRG